MFYDMLTKTAKTRSVKSDEKKLKSYQKHAPIIGSALGAALPSIAIKAIHNKPSTPMYLGSSLIGAGIGGYLGHKAKKRAKKRAYLKSNFGNASDSSMIRNIGRRDNKTYVRFSDGSVYETDLNDKQHRDLINAESTGSFYNRLRFKDRISAKRINNT